MGDICIEEQVQFYKKRLRSYFMDLAAFLAAFIAVLVFGRSNYWVVFAVWAGLLIVRGIDLNQLNVCSLFHDMWAKWEDRKIEEFKEKIKDAEKPKKSSNGKTDGAPKK